MHKKILIALLVALVLVSGLLMLKNRNQKASPLNDGAVQELKANLTINDGQTNPTFDITQFIGRTALEATEAKLSGNIETSGTGQNAFVTSLNGRIADNNKREFWEFVVNGKQAEVGVGSYKIENGDTIVWQISTY